MKFYSVTTSTDERTTVCEYCGWSHMFHVDQFENGVITDLDTGENLCHEKWSPLCESDKGFIGVRVEIMGGLMVSPLVRLDGEQLEQGKEFAFIKINYCPMCGRKIDREEKQFKEVR